jgi:hypothetical protein
VTAAETDTFHPMILVAPYLWKIEEHLVGVVDIYKYILYLKLIYLPSIAP